MPKTFMVLLSLAVILTLISTVDTAGKTQAYQAVTVSGNHLASENQEMLLA